MSQRKLYQEIDKLLKKVKDGLSDFDSIYENFQETETSQQSYREKLEGDLKREIKKLQKHRDQIKTWLSKEDVKERNDVLVENRRLIEIRMEEFKAVEKLMKTKQFSTEALSNPDIIQHPREILKREQMKFIEDSIDELKKQLESYEAQKLTHKCKRNTFHIANLENILKLVTSNDMEPEKIQEFHDDIEYYVENNEDPDFVEYDTLYEDMGSEVNPDDMNDTNVVQSPKKCKSKKTRSTKSNVTGTSSKQPITSSVDISTKEEEDNGEEDEEDNDDDDDDDGEEGKKKEGKATINESSDDVPINHNPHHVSDSSNNTSDATSVTRNVKNDNVDSTVTNNDSSNDNDKITGLTASNATTTTNTTKKSVEYLQSDKREGVSDLKLSSAPSTTTPSSSGGTIASNINAKKDSVDANKNKSEMPELKLKDRTQEIDSMIAENLKLPAFQNKHFNIGLKNLVETKRQIVQPSEKLSEEMKQELESSLLNCPDSLDSEVSKLNEFQLSQPHPTSIFFPSEPIRFFYNSDITETPNLKEGDVYSRTSLAQIMSKFDLDTLFFIFYHYQGTYEQFLSARELSLRGWQFNKVDRFWYYKEEEVSFPDSSSNENGSISNADNNKNDNNNVSKNNDSSDNNDATSVHISKKDSSNKIVTSWRYFDYEKSWLSRRCGSDFVYQEKEFEKI